MSATPLRDVWEAAASQPYQALVGKDSQFTLGFTLLVTAILLSGVFGLNNNLKSLSIYALPASLAFGFGAVFMICAVGVYV